MPQLPLRRSSPRPGHLIVCGETALASRLVEELVARYEENVVFITPPRRRGAGDRRRVPQVKGVTVVEATEIDDEVLRNANIATARALAIVNQDDVGNIHLALRARALNPDVRLVVHFFNSQLGTRVSNLFRDCKSMSDSEVAAPSFVAAAFDDAMTLNHVRVAGRTVFATPRSRVRRRRVICGLVDDATSDQPTVLPDDPADAAVVLAVADGGTNLPGALRIRLAMAAYHLRSLFSGILRFSLVIMLALVIVGAVLFRVYGHTTIWDAFYQALLDIAGATNPEDDTLGNSVMIKITKVLVTVVGIAIIPLFTAAVVDAVVGSRLHPYTARRRVPYRGHVIVVGLGNVGTRVIRRLHDLGIPAVCVETSENALGIPVARSRRMRIPVIVGDATREETLQAASAGTCRAVLAVTSDDVTNLEAGLQARELRKDLRVVLRIGNDDLARRVHQTFGVNVSRSVSYLAAPAFAAAMLEREVVGTLPAGRRVLLIARVPVRGGSMLVGYRLGDISESGQIRVIALQPGEGQPVDWSPPSHHVLAPGNELFVVATRTGLSRVLGSSIGDTTPTPAARD
ncbi:MAG: NAD-binding protein [Streptosporangiales bacterium]|nr:NAD-binding protein [Streptosporangiales bacterium]MBO0890903.1 NAD-binding protein [Acidothermales bacterium]